MVKEKNNLDMKFWTIEVNYQTMKIPQRTYNGFSKVETTSEISLRVGVLKNKIDCFF